MYVVASYKVIQDIEAEDKLLGPLTLRQFIYAVIVVVQLFIMFKLYFVQPFLIAVFLPTVVLFGVLAAPFGHDQSSEVWLLAKIRFFLKPRLRKWDQSGLQQLVQITAPKHVEENRTNGLDETQVQSRLQALAQTIDTRGWAIKGVDVNLYTNPAYSGAQNSDRLVDPSVMAPKAVPDLDIRADDDILDTQNSTLAQKMNQLVSAKDKEYRQEVLERMDQARKVSQGTATIPPLPATPPAPVNTPLPVLHPVDHQAAYGQTPVLKPLTAQPAAATPTPPTPVTANPNTGILQLARNDDLSVATIARQVNNDKGSDNGEVVISLR